MQSKKRSLIESFTNVVIGFMIAFISQTILFKIFNKSITMGENCWIGLWMTFISIVRSYTLRRIFTRKD